MLPLEEILDKFNLSVVKFLTTKVNYSRLGNTIHLLYTFWLLLLRDVYWADGVLNRERHIFLFLHDIRAVVIVVQLSYTWAWLFCRFVVLYIVVLYEPRFKRFGWFYPTVFTFVTAVNAFLVFIKNAPSNSLF